MNLRLKTAVAAILAVSMVSTYGYAADGTPKKPAARKAKEKGPTVEEQIEALRQQMQGQIDSLKTNLSDKDAQLKQAQQAAADAQAAAAKAQAAADAQNQAVQANTEAVGTLNSTVTDMKSANASAVSSLSDEQAAIKKSIANPNVLHYKGISLTPGGYAAAETVWRQRSTGGDIPTAFSGLPYEHADAYTLSEFYGSARQSRVSLMAEGKVNWGTLRGYWEADWLGTGITSNNNQSNSYVLRQRVIWGQAETNNHWAFTGGQLWSLATEDKKGLSNLSGDIMTPQTIDPNYVTGFVWTRQYGFRVTKTMNKVAFGIAFENPQVLYTASLAGNTPYAVLGSAGNNGGNYNAAISTEAITTYVQNYVPEPGTLSYLPVYNTVTANTNIANYSFNYAPDVIVKVALDPGFGHYEIIGIGRFAHETDLSRRDHGRSEIREPEGHHNWCRRSGLRNLGRRVCKQHRARRHCRQLPRSGHEVGEFWRQGVVWTRSGPLRRHHSLRRHRQQLGRPVTAARLLWIGNPRNQPQRAPCHLRELRHRLCGPQRLGQPRQHNPRRPHRNLLPHRLYRSVAMHRQALGRAAGCRRHLGRPLGHSLRFGTGIRLSLAERQPLQHDYPSGLQRQFDGLLPRRRLRRPNPQCSGSDDRATGTTSTAATVAACGRVFSMDTRSATPGRELLLSQARLASAPRVSTTCSGPRSVTTCRNRQTESQTKRAAPNRAAHFVVG